jgi:hypothetical protein
MHPNSHSISLVAGGSEPEQRAVSIADGGRKWNALQQKWTGQKIPTAAGGKQTPGNEKCY